MDPAPTNKWWPEPPRAGAVYEVVVPRPRWWKVLGAFLCELIDGEILGEFLPDWSGKRAIIRRRDSTTVVYRERKVSTEIELQTLIEILTDDLNALSVDEFEAKYVGPKRSHTRRAGIGRSDSSKVVGKSSPTIETRERAMQTPDDFDPKGPFYVALDRKGIEHSPSGDVSWVLPGSNGEGGVSVGQHLKVRQPIALLDVLDELIYEAEPLHHEDGMKDGVLRVTGARLVRLTRWNTESAAGFAIDCAHARPWRLRRRRHA
jgi:hypothetical protein